MRLFCKCPLPEVGSPDWPWEDDETTTKVKFNGIECEKRGCSMPGYKITLSNRIEDGCVEVKASIVGGEDDGSYWTRTDDRSIGFAIATAKEVAEQDARRRWVRQNLLTMQALDIGYSDADEELYSKPPKPRKKAVKKATAKPNELY